MRIPSCKVQILTRSKNIGERTNARYEGVGRRAKLSRWGQGIQGELQAAPVLIAEGKVGNNCGGGIGRRFISLRIIKR